jgi:CheY-like chemotaxis protein
MVSFRRTVIVDDDPASQFLLKMVLEDLNISRDIVTLSNGREALEYLRLHCLNEKAAPHDCPDWILLDLNMPVMGGLEFLAKLQQLERHNLICSSVTVITSSSYPKDKQEAQQYGVRGYLLKPLTEENMRQHLNL